MGVLKDGFDIFTDLLARLKKQKTHIKVYSQRRDLNWRTYLNTAQSRYWVCGTSLIPVANNIMDLLVSNKIDDFRIILPYPKKGFTSYLQLKQFNDNPNGPAEYQLGLAEDTYLRIRKILEQNNKSVPDYLRQYSGVIYSNITLFDRDVFISNYDATGIGDKSFTIHVHGVDTEEYQHIKSVFLWMWDASLNYGRIGKNSKPKGASIIFINKQREVLLALRHDISSVLYPGKWDILGGNVKDEETPLQCILREMKEEIEIDIGKPQLFNVYDMEDRIEYTYWQERNLNIEETTFNEGQKLKWFSHDEILNLSEKEIAFNFKPVLLEFFANAPFS